MLNQFREVSGGNCLLCFGNLIKHQHFDKRWKLVNDLNLLYLQDQKEKNDKN